MPNNTLEGCNLFAMNPDTKEWSYLKNDEWIPCANPGDLAKVDQQQLGRLHYSITDPLFSKFKLDPDQLRELLKIDPFVLDYRLDRMTPLVKTNEGFFKIDKTNIDPVNTAYMWDISQAIKQDPILIGDKTTWGYAVHSCGYAAFFKPSLAEVLACMPRYVDQRIGKPFNAFYIDEYGVYDETKADFHYSKVVWCNIEDGFHLTAPVES